MKDLRVIVSMMLICKFSDVVEYDRRRLGLPSTPLDMDYDNSNGIERREIAMS